VWWPFLAANNTCLTCQLALPPQAHKQWQGTPQAMQLGKPDLMVEGGHSYLVAVDKVSG
jgi:hypothetical protein